jgi:two-component system, NarL family, response regulator DevR
MICGTISSFLITHNRLLGEALTRTIGEEADIRALGAAPFSRETMEKIASEDPDVVVADSVLDTASGLEIVPEIRRCAPRAKIVLIGMEADKELFLDAVRDGIVGYVLNDASSKEVVEAIRAVVQGVAICPPSLCLTLFQVACGVGLHAGKRLGLTRREQQLAAMIGQGLTNKEIASQLFISEHTVKNQVHRMLHKLGVSRRLAIVELCRKSAHLAA